MAPPRPSASERPNLIYAIGDIHGCLEALEELEELIAGDAGGTTGEKWIVCLGDYIDRGARSAQVLDHLLSAPPAGFRRICLRGNHEAMMLAALADPRELEHWLPNGGDTTLRSYGVGGAQLETLWRGNSNARRQLLDAHVPSEHVAFLADLPILFDTPGAIFVHAGLRPGRPLAAQSETDLLWIRDEFLSGDHDFGALVVHGHTPEREPTVRPHRIGIDTACYLTGRLTALRLDRDGNRAFLQTGGP